MIEILIVLLFLYLKIIIIKVTKNHFYKKIIETNKIKILFQLLKKPERLSEEDIEILEYQVLFLI